MRRQIMWCGLYFLLAGCAVYTPVQRPAVVYEAPRPVYVAPQPVYYYDPPVAYAPAPAPVYVEPYVQHNIYLGIGPAWHDHRGYDRRYYRY